MDTQIARGGVVIGTFQLQDLPNAVAEGAIFFDDYAWHEGLSGWTPVSELCTSHIEPEGQSKISRSPDHRGNDLPQFDPSNREWRDKPITSHQVTYLKSFGVAANRQMKRGEAYDLIDQCTRDPKALQFQAELKRKKNEEREAQWLAAEKAAKKAEQAARKNRTALGAFALRVDVEKAKSEIETWKAEKASNSLLYRTKKKELALLKKKLANTGQEKKVATPRLIEDLEGEFEEIENETEVLEGEIEELEDEIGSLDPTANPDPDDLSDLQDELKEYEDTRIQFWKRTFDDDWLELDDWDLFIDVADTINRLYSEFGRNFKPPTKKMIREVLTALDSKSADWDKVSPELFFGVLVELFPSETQPLPPKPAVSRQPKPAIKNRLIAKPGQVSAPRRHPKPTIANRNAEGCLGMVLFAFVGSGVFGAMILLFRSL